MIRGKKIFLKILSEEDINERYINWMNDPEITQYLDSGNRSYSLIELKDYVKSINSSNHSYLFGIFDNDERTHIGNIKIGNINALHRRADVGLLVGEKSFWGKNIATEAIILATNFAFIELNLNKLFAGMYSPNIGSYKAFLKAGYSKVGEFTKHSFFKGEYVNSILVEILNEDFKNSSIYEKNSNHSS